MSNNSSSGRQKGFSRFKLFLSSVLRRSPASGRRSHLPQDDTGSPDVPPPPAEGPPPVSTSHRRSISNISIHSTANSLQAHPSPSPPRLTHHSENSAYQNDSSPNPPVLPQPPQDQPYAEQRPSGSNHTTPGLFSLPQVFSIDNPVSVETNTSENQFMEKLLQHSIIGAEFESARGRPHRAHPETLLAIIQRCLDFILNCHDKEKLRWVVGVAGVGKSAIMETVAEEVPDGVIFVSVFFFINGRNDGTKAIVTIAYQLAVQCRRYRQFIRDEIACDPSLLYKSLPVQFKQFIVEPFIHRHLFDPPCRFLIAIDGLDECGNPLIQRNLLELISDFCISYPTSPIAWIVASRPEPHITSFFDRAEVKPAYTKEEITIDAGETRHEVEQFLRHELNMIKMAYPTLISEQEWPSEHEINKIAKAAGRFFEYAMIVVRYIGDPHYRNPTARLDFVLDVLDGGLRVYRFGASNPMAQLYALYTRILSDIPSDVMPDTRRLLLLGSSTRLFMTTFRQLCSLLGLAEDAAYAALRHLHAVMKVPQPDKADGERLECFYKSFGSFLFDPRRSGFSHNAYDEAGQLMVETLLKIIDQVPYDSNGVNSGKGIQCYNHGYLKGGPGSCESISLSWPGDEHSQMTDDELRLNLYRDSIFTISANFGSDHNFRRNMSCFHVLTTRFTALGIYFPLVQLRNYIFSEFRHELAQLGKLEQVPLRTLDYAAICGAIEIGFTSPIGTKAELSNPWEVSCDHDKTVLQGVQEWPGWSTVFYRFVPISSGTKDDAANADIPRFNTVACKECHRHTRGSFADQCDYCSRRFARHFINNPNQLATLYVDSTEMCYVEFSFVDPNDGVSKWTYWFCHSGLPTPVDV